jgi:hypothetical protein
MAQIEQSIAAPFENLEFVVQPFHEAYHLNRLKGEQGKPDIQPSQRSTPVTRNVSSERERRKPHEWQKRPGGRDQN